MISPLDLQRLMERQSRANSSVNLYWTQANYPFERSIGILSAIALSTGGWAWCPQRDRPAMLRTLCGIWRCTMSRYLSNADNEVTTAARALLDAMGEESDLEFDGHSVQLADLSIPKMLELLAGLGFGGRMEPALFRALLNDLSVGWPQLMEALEGDARAERAVLPWTKARFNRLILQPA
ncbi:MAG: hypothetical protein EPN77_19310 [Candidimonas sp.]|nr:MAG: hypothetical protein EPN77_19310 [Candidimonas sp.]